MNTTSHLSCLRSSRPLLGLPRAIHAGSLSLSLDVRKTSDGMWQGRETGLPCCWLGSKALKHSSYKYQVLQ